MQSFVPLARNSLLVALLMVHATCSALLPDAVWINPILSRRNALASGVASAGFLLGNSSKGQKLALAEEGGQTYQTYKVEPDASAALSPRLTAIPNDAFLEKIASTKGGTLWLGEHHNAAADHNLQVQLLRLIAKHRSNGPVAVGLEQVQVKFQPVLNDYTAGKISIGEMRAGVEWDIRWVWPFEVYQPVFETARELKMPLIALNVNSEDLALVEKGGLPGLPKDRLQVYIRDASGFAAFAKARQFGTYVDYVIAPSYDLHQTMGLLKYTMSGEKLEQQMSFRNFLSGRILWDEAMASTAYEWTRKNNGGLLVGLVGADHVKFRNGIPGRYERMVGDDGDCISIMLNPTLIDTRPSGTVASTDAAMSSQISDRITLQLRYLNENVDLHAQTLPESTGGVMPLADYLVIGQ